MAFDARPADQDPARLLFVCVENSCRSQMAEAFARRHGGVDVASYSAGSRPSGRVNPTAIRVMKEIGYDLRTHRSKSVDEVLDLCFDVVVTMGCGDECPHVSALRREDWDIPDPKETPLEEFRLIRDRIETEVRRLLISVGAG